MIGTMNMYRCRNIVILLVMMLLPISVLGAASFKAVAPKQVIQGNKFSIRFELENAQGSSFQGPEVGGCKFLYGPSQSRMMSSSFINGKSTSSSSESYTMTYRAEKAGKYTVGPASISVGGKIYKTNAFTLEILPPDKSATQRGNQSQGVQIYDADSQSAGKAVGKNDVFVRIILSKSSAYEQEGIMCTIKLYTKYNIQQFMATRQPTFDGFISQELPITSSINRIENYKGENYMVADLKQCILFPQQSGKLTINSGTYDLTVIQYENIRSFFGIMRQPVEKKIQVNSNSASIVIDPLPQPRPADFIGAVGQFTASLDMVNKQYKTNEAGTLRFTLKGQGNLKNVKTPTFEFPSQFDVYDPQTTVNANPSGNSLVGSVQIDYAFVPQYVGKFQLPSSTVSYFDPNAKKYVQLSLKGFEMNVAKGSGTSNAGQEIKQNKDILHIKTGDLDLVPVNHVMLVDRGGYVFWYIIPLLLFAAVLFYYRKSIKERANVALMKNKRANKVAAKRLKLGRQLMEKQQRDRFYEEMLRALWGYLSDKLTIPVSQLNRDNISAELRAFGISEELNKQILDLLDDCEFARYAKSEENGNDMSVIYQKACDSINQVENTKRK